MKCEYKKCLRRTLKGYKKCIRHVLMTQKFYNEECPICLGDDEKDMYPLSCLHRIHKECAKGLTKLECPLCKQKIINFPDSLVDQIKKNGKKLEQEREEEERREILESMNFLIPPQMVILQVIREMIDMGVPPDAIPSSIGIHFDTPDMHISSELLRELFLDSLSDLLNVDIDESDDGDDDDNSDTSSNERRTISSTGNAVVGTITFFLSDLPPFE